MDEQLDRWMGRCMNGWIVTQLDRYMDEWLDGWIARQLSRWAVM